jgi:cyclohexadieny/prephenate dehydrogenase
MNIGILGIGLIGSSLARAFSHHKISDVLIYDRDPRHLEEAQNLGLGSRYFKRASGLASESDIIFICVPAGAIVGVIKDLVPHLKKGVILTDVGSVKSSITKDVKSFLPKDFFFVPGHPISGAEHSGPAAGRADLFENRPYVLIDDGSAREALEKIKIIVEKIGAKALCLNADAHDLIFAYTSHLPHLCAFAAMMGTARASQLAGQDIANYAAPSFRDLTRVAASNAEMWRDIFLANRTPIIEAYKLFRKEMDHLASLIEKGETTAIENYITKARILRERL